MIAAHGTPDTIGTGANLALEESLCHHMSTGAGPRRCDDVALEPAYAELEACARWTSSATPACRSP